MTLLQLFFITLHVLSYILVAIAAALGPYFLLRRLFATRSSDDSQTMATSIIVRLGALHALILALVFAQEQLNYIEVRHTIADEAAATADVYYEIGYYEGADTGEIKANLARYVQTVIEEEWTLLRYGMLSDEAWRHYSKVNHAIINLAPSSPADIEIRKQCLEDWDDVSIFRRSRELAANHTVPMFFWIIAILGFFCVSMPYYAFAPSGVNILALTIFAVYNGLVFFFIVNISNPFAGPAPIDATVFQHLFSEDMREFLQGRT
jgi:hypothetical protein